MILGIKTAVNFSYKNKLLKKREHQLIIDHITNSRLPSTLSNFLKIKDITKIISFMTKDKKNNSNKINLVLLKKIGLPSFDEQYSKKNIEFFLKNYLGN